MISIIGIPLALIWICGIGQWWSRHYFAKLECTLDERSISFRKGIFIVVEKTIPLENIQDVTFTEGPILRRFNLSILKFETAGYSENQAHSMSLVGILDAHDFRTAILAQREKLRFQLQNPGSSGSTSLEGIESRLDEIIFLLKRTS